MRKGLILGLFVLLTVEIGWADFTPKSGRGKPSEYDPGPKKGSKWAELFGSAPNYRAIGKHVLGGEDKFRWVFGPMWYRGRLGSNQVKAFIVGQEGAQDENISNRTFTGSTGTKTQNFLNYLGLRSSYLIMNTFVYTINGQLADDPKFKWLEQSAEKDAESPIVEYRHSLFDNMIKENSQSLALIMGVGSGGKASVATWVNARGGSCSPANDLAKCDTNRMKDYFAQKGIKIKNPILVIGVPHPGGASQANGGADALNNIVRGFTNAAKRVASRVKEDSSYRSAWFEELDEIKYEGGSQEKILTRLNGEYKYKDAPVPFRDFAFGINWRMGDEGTTSNRWGADSIQVFSKKGTYGDKSSKFTARTDNVSGLVEVGGEKRIVGMESFDLAYEMPRYDSKLKNHVNLYDAGPCGDSSGESASECSLSKALQSWPDFNSLGIKGPTSHGSLGYGPIYRGRLNSAKLLVLADQMSHDDFFSGRAATGEEGQHLQRLFDVVGADLDYAILRTLPVDTLGMPESDVITLATNEKVVKARIEIIKQILSSKKVRAVVTMGSVADVVAKAIPDIAPLLVGNLTAPTSDAHVKQWKQVAPLISKKLGTNLDGEYSAKLESIAREDLPAHTRWWMGSTGTRASRGTGNGEGDYYRVWAPRWESRLQPVPLTAAQRNEIDRKLKNANLGGRAPEDAKDTEFTHKQYVRDDVKQVEGQVEKQLQKESDQGKRQQLEENLARLQSLRGNEFELDQDALDPENQVESIDTDVIEQGQAQQAKDSKKPKKKPASRRRGR